MLWAIIDQDNNSVTGNTTFSRRITLDEFFLCSMGRDLGADIVAYYIGGSVNGIGGKCVAPLLLGPVHWRDSDILMSPSTRWTTRPPLRTEGNAATSSEPQFEAASYSVYY